MSFRLKGDDPDKLRQVVEQSRRARPCSTSSPTVCPWPSTSRPADRRDPASHDDDDEHTHPGRWPSRTRPQPVPHGAWPRSSRARTRSGRRAVAQRTMELAALAHAELDDPLARLDIRRSRSGRIHDRIGSRHILRAADAASFAAPVVEGTTVQQVIPRGDRFAVTTDQGPFAADNVVIATGWCDRPAVPAVGRQLSPHIYQIVPSAYRGPDDLPSGGVLVVGASATGVQLADELRSSGRDVTIAVGSHGRLPRCVSRDGHLLVAGGHRHVRSHRR